MVKRLTGSIACFFYLMLLTACGGGGGAKTTDGGGGNNGQPTTLSGTISYEYVPALYDQSSDKGTLAFSRSIAKPVRNAVVEVVQGTTVLATTTTDESGDYQITYTAQGSIQPALVVLAESALPAIQVQDNTDQNAVWGVISSITAGSTTKNLYARSGWNGRSYDNSSRFAAPFAILDSLYTAAKGFVIARNASYPSLVVRWSPDNVPQSGDKAEGQIGNSHFSSSENAIYILGKDGVDTDEFDTHVIAHEWAHFFQYNLSRSDSLGGAHYLGDQLDPTLSFGEGSATALAAILLNDPVYLDTYWHNGSIDGFALNAEADPANADDQSPGVFSEISNMRVVYDIFDSAAGESFDRVTLGIGTLYDVLVGPITTTDALVTLGAFVSNIKQQQGVDPAAVDDLLAHYQIGAITTSWGDGDSTLRQMYREVLSFPSTFQATLQGGYRWNESAQSQYYVFTGDGSILNITATSPQDVAILLYQAGVMIDGADDYSSGSERIQIRTVQNRRYVVVLKGLSEVSGSYQVTMNFSTL